MKVLTVGVYDLLHWGHFELFRRCKELAGEGGEVIVAIQSDEWVSKFKDVKLTYNWGQRAKMIAALRYVDKVVSYTSVDDTIKMLSFDKFVVGPDQNHTGFQRAKDWCRVNGKEVILLPRTAGISSSILRGVATTKHVESKDVCIC